MFLIDSQASLIFLHACCGLISKQIAAKQYTEIVHKSSTEFLTGHNGLKFLNILVIASSIVHPWRLANRHASTVDIKITWYDLKI